MAAVQKHEKLSNRNLIARLVNPAMMAEATGFEPVKGCYTLNDLANRRFQPLSHASRYNSLKCFIYAAST